MRPAPIQPEAVPLARRPAQSGEWEVWLSVQRAFLAASQSGGSGQPCAVFEKPLLAADPRDLLVVLLSPAIGNVALSGVVGIVGADENGLALTGQAALGHPHWIGAPPGTPLPVGAGFPVEVPPGRRWSRIDAVIPAIGLRVGVVAVPDPATLQRVGCIVGRELNAGREVRLTATGAPFESSLHVPSGELTVIGTPTATIAGGLGAFHRSTCCALVKVNKSGLVTEHLLLLDWTPTVRLSAGDGEATPSTTATGPFTALVTLAAPDA